MPSSEKPTAGGNKLLNLHEERNNFLNLLKEAADSVHASTAEDGISDDRKNYRVNLERRIREALKNAKHKE